MVKVCIKSTKKYSKYIKPHLEEEHPTTRGHIRIEERHFSVPLKSDMETDSEIIEREKMTIFVPKKLKYNGTVWTGEI